MAGTVDDAVLALEDGDGVSMRDALLAFGDDPAGLAAMARARGAVLGYCEVGDGRSRWTGASTGPPSGRVIGPRGERPIP